jgi:hypothetical protein
MIVHGLDNYSITCPDVKKIIVEMFPDVIRKRKISSSSS